MAKSKLSSTLGQVVKSIPIKEQKTNKIKDSKHKIKDRSTKHTINKKNKTNPNRTSTQSNRTSTQSNKISTQSNTPELVKCSCCKTEATYYWDCNTYHWTWACPKCRIFGYITQWKNKKPSTKVMRTLAMLRILNFSPESRFDTIQSITSNKTNLNSLYSELENDSLSSSIWDDSDGENELNKTIVGSDSEEEENEDDEEDPEPGIGEEADAEYFGYEIWEEDDNDFDDEEEDDDDDYEEGEEEEDAYDGSYSDDE